MILKEGVKSIGIRPELMIGIMAANEVYRSHQKDLVITSLNDSKHSSTSLHYSGCGADFRTRYFETNEEKQQVTDEIKKRLTNDYDVILEKDHIHMEYQPKA